MAVLAPTGIAAIHAGGVTVHSFFQLPFGTFIPEAQPLWTEQDQQIVSRTQLLGKLRLRQERRDLIRSLELLIIDEVSMLRADVLDAVDAILRAVRRNMTAPFGGLQVLFIGDLFQLPPVVRQDELRHLAPYYPSPFFIHAQALQEQPPLYLELKKIYRQKDSRFIGLLEKVRNNRCQAEDYELLNRYYQPHFQAGPEDGYITLTTHNATAQTINERELAKLPGTMFEISAIIKKEFPEAAYPNEKNLRLKVGAQIMFIKNDKGQERRYFNGKIGKIHQLDPIEKKITVVFPGETEPLELELETWRNIRYHYDRENDEINEEELGTFQQYPIRLAWAVTIHKSQGLTFEKAIIDAGRSFAPGQVYVALSRMTGLQGMVLHSRIPPHSILVDPAVQEYSRCEKPPEALDALLERSRADYARSLILDAYEWRHVQAAFEACYKKIRDSALANQASALHVSGEMLDALQELAGTGAKFRQFINRSFSGPAALDALLHKNKKACAWFCEAIAQELKHKLKNHQQTIRSKSPLRAAAKKYLQELDTLYRLLEEKEAEITRTEAIIRALIDGKDMKSAFAPRPKKQGDGIPVQGSAQTGTEAAPTPGDSGVSKKRRGDSALYSLQLFKAGKTVDEIAATRNLNRSTVTGHLIGFISSGEIDPDHFIEKGKCAELLNMARAEENRGSLRDLKEACGPRFSFDEIKAALAYKQFLETGGVAKSVRPASAGTSA